MRAALTGLLALLLLPAAAQCRAGAAVPRAVPGGDALPGRGGPAARDGRLPRRRAPGLGVLEPRDGGLGRLFRPSLGHPGGPRRARADRRGTSCSPRRSRSSPPPGPGPSSSASSPSYRGRPVERLLEVRRGGGERRVAAVSGATISSLVINDAILRAARAVARAKGLLGQPGGIDRESFEPADWAALVADGSIVARRVSLGEVDGAPGAPRTCGRKLPRATRRACSSSCSWRSPRRPGSAATSSGAAPSPGSRPGLGPDDHLLFVGAHAAATRSRARPGSGAASFERLALAQGDRTIRFAQRGPCPARRAGGGGCARAARGGPVRRPRRRGLPAGRAVAAAAPDPRPRRRGPVGPRGARDRLPPAGPLPGAAAARSRPPAPAWREVWLGRVPDLVVLGTALAALTGRVLLPGPVGAAAAAVGAAADRLPPVHPSGSAGTPRPSSRSSTC